MTSLCLENIVDKGRLLYHTLTCELLFLEREEYPEDYLSSHYFLVPQEFDECAVSDSIRKTLRFYQSARMSGYKTYTILPTTDCNARCFYCFELGTKPQSMNAEMARKVAEYIYDTADRNSKIKLRFFGGEPLLGEGVLDQITTYLTEKKISFSSDIVTNGYLFTPELIRKAKDRWLLKEAQITLDGTEKVYNMRKAYMKDRDGAYQRVSKNIENLLEAGINVRIRLNMDRSNYADLTELAAELAERYKKYSGFSVYPHLLFQDILTPDIEKQAAVYQLFQAFEEQLKKAGLYKPARLPKAIKTSYCIADNPEAVVILPDGRLHACEHYSDNHCFGDIDRRIPKTTDLPYWEDPFEAPAECRTCPLYAICFRTRHCPDIPERCIPEERERRISRLRESILQTHQSSDM